MTGVSSLAIAAVSGGGVTALLQFASGWVKSRHAHRHAAKTADVKLEEHRDQLTFDLLKAAREEISRLATEAAELRPLLTHVAHLEEALDHLHALLHAEGETEINAAKRRATAFLRRMRPQVGDLRNAAQTVKSARRVADNLGEGP